MDIAERIAGIRREIASLKAAIESRKAQLQNGGLSAVGVSPRPLWPAPRLRAKLDGHYNKVYACDWTEDGECLVTAGPLKHRYQSASWRAACETPSSITVHMQAMTARFMPGSSRFVACGGLDNICSIVDVCAPAHAKPAQVLVGHDGYVSGCAWMNDTNIVTTSGDSTCRLWDVPTRTALMSFTDHASDVMCVCAHPHTQSVFVTGSVDATARVWDSRAGSKAMQTFVGHEGDVNAVQFMRNGLAFGTGGEDSRIKLFDLRSYARVNELMNESMVCSVTSLAFSHSGRIAFAGYDDCNVYGWDCLEENPAQPAYSLRGHTHRVSCVATNPKGWSIATGAWDNHVHIWA